MDSKMSMDQAEGLRRMFHAQPPAVMAVVPCGAVTTPWVAGQLKARAHAVQSILVLDEGETYGNLSDCLGVSPRFNLLHAAAGQVALQQCLSEAAAGLSVAQAGGLAHAIGSDRVVTQRCLDTLKALQNGYDEWFLLSQAAEIEGISMLTLAAPRTILVVDEHPKALTIAWSTLSRLARRAPGMAFGVCHAGQTTGRSEANLASFSALAEKRLGIRVWRSDSLDPHFGSDVPLAEAFADAFIQRLRQTSHLAARGLGDTRLPGSKAHDTAGAP